MNHVPSSPFLRRALPAALVAAALVAGCSSSSDKADTTAKNATTPAAQSPAPGAATPSPQPPPPVGADNPALKDFYAQKLDWAPCKADPDAQKADSAVAAVDRKLQCAKMRVPLDYAAPGTKSIEVAVYRLPAKGGADNRLGSLATNPGGPGSGVRYTVTNLAASRPGLAERYDIIGFDPRGTGNSSQVDCADGPLMDRLQSIDPTPDAAQVESAAAVLKEFGQGCAARMGDLLPRIGTTEAVDDMDVLRGVVGDEKLNYVGTSYGTYLGARYAERHPGRVGRLVLDGLLDPASDRMTLAREQAEGFELAFRAFAKDCIGKADCPFKGSVDNASASMRAKLDKLSATPAKVGKRAVDEGMASAVISAYLYSPKAWPSLRVILKSLYAGDAQYMLNAFDAYADRAKDGTYKESSLPGYFEINCADGRVLSAAEAAALGRDISATAPVLGPSVVWSWAADCAAPGADRPGRLDAAKLPGLLLISTTRDPATPHVAAARYKEQLPSSSLITYDGDGHVAFYRQSPCVDNAVDGYLLDGKLPGDLNCD